MTTYDPEDKAERSSLGGLLHDFLAHLGMRRWRPKIRQRPPSATQLAKFLQFSKPILAGCTSMISTARATNLRFFRLSLPQHRLATVFCRVVTTPTVSG